MKKARKILALLLVCLMVFTLAACGGTSDSDGGDSDGGGSSDGGGGSSDGGGGGSSDGGGTTASGRDTLTVAIDNDSGTLIPGRVNGGQYYALLCVYESLWEVDEDYNFRYQLMESYEEIAPDHWRVKLREGVYFTNGQELTADDVIFSLAFWKTIPINSVRVQSLDAERTVAVDRYTVDMFMLNGYYYYHDTAASMFMIHSSYGYEDILQKIANGDEITNDMFAAFEEAIAVNPVSTGPYVVTDYVVNSHLFLERRDDYWGTPPEVEKIQFRVLAEPSQRANGIATGSVDISAIALADFNYIDGLSSHYTISRYLGGGVGLSFNSGVNGYFNRFTDPDKSLEARFAVYHAIDPTVLINLVYEGKGRIMHNVVPDYMFDYKEEYNHMHEAYDIGYNVDRARELAQSSGLAGQTISIMTNGLAEAVLTAEIVQSMLAAIDVTLEIRNYDPATMTTMIYDPLAEHDITVGAGIAPNRRVCDLLLNGVRYSSVLTILADPVTGLPAFTGNDWYLENCAKMAHEPNTADRVAVTEQCLQMYLDNAIGFGLAATETAVAFSNDIDPNSIVFSVTTGMILLAQLRYN